MTLFGILLLQFVLGPERSVAPVRAAFTSPQQVVQSTATDGTNQFVVWIDGRNDLPAHVSSASLVVAARVDAEGNVLDVPNIVLPISAARGSIYTFWNGREYVVVTGRQYVRVSAAGELLDRVAQSYPSFESPRRFAWSGDRLLAVDQRPHAWLYDGSFNTIRQDFDVPLASDLGDTAIASNGDGFLLAGTYNRRDLRIMALDRNGQVTRDPSTILRADLASDPLMASDGHDYLVAFRTATLVEYPWYYGYSYFKDYTFLMFAIHGDGTVFGGGGASGSPLESSAADLQWQGDHYSLVYDAAYNIYNTDPWWAFSVDAIEIDRKGNAPAKSTALVTGRPAHLEASAGAGPRMLFWSTEVTPPGIDRTYSTANGQPYGDAASFDDWKPRRFVLGQGSAGQESPAIATAGDVSLLVWRERTSAYDPLVLNIATVDRTGTVAGTPLRIADYTCDCSQPSVATDGRNFLVGWQESQSIRVMRIGHDGKPIDPASVSIAETTKPCFGLAPVLAFNGTDYLAAWRADLAVRARKIGTDGTLGEASLIAPSVNPKSTIPIIAAASNGRDFAVAWEETSRVYVTRIGSEGYPKDFGGILTGLFGLSSFFWSGGNYVAMTYDRYQRLGADGRLADAKPVQMTQLPLYNRPVCNGGTCLMYQVSNGELLETHYGDSPSGFTIDTKAVATVDTADWRSILFFGDAHNLAYLRMAPEAPYAGSWHLFVRPAMPPRAHAVR